MEREAELAHQPFLALGQGEVPQAEVVEEGGAVAAELMKQVVVEVACPRALQGGAEHGLGLLGGAGGPSGQLRGYLEALARVALDERAADGHLAAAAVVGPSGVEVGEACSHELVGHGVHRALVDGQLSVGSLLFGQPHEAEAERRQPVL